MGKKPESSLVVSSEKAFNPFETERNFIVVSLFFFVM